MNTYDRRYRFLTPPPPLTLARNRDSQTAHIRNGTAALCGQVLRDTTYAPVAIARESVCKRCLASKQWKESEKMR